MILHPDDPRQMFFSCRADWVADEPLVTVVEQVVGGLDLDVLYSRYSEAGRPFYDPEMMLKVLFYSYCEGVRSSREIAKRVRYDVRYRYYTGCLQPDFRTINRFRSENLDLLGHYFAQIVSLCERSGLLDVSVLAVDSTKIRASASGRRAVQRRKLDELARRYREELSRDAARDDSHEEAADNSDSQPSASGDHGSGPNVEEPDIKRSEVKVADPDARFMKTNEGGRRLSYNSHIVVDKGQMIVAAEVSNCADDSVQLQSMIESSRRNVDGEFGQVLADGGYYSGNNVKYAAQSGIDLYLPIANSGGRVPDDCYHRDVFIYDKSTDSYRCPAGEQLHYQGSRRRGDVNKRVYAGCASSCGRCRVRPRCTSGRYRRLEISENYSYEKQMKAKLNSERGRAIYRQRMPLVEPVFGNLKFNLGFKRFALRTLAKVRGEFLLMCMAHNLKKLARYGSLSGPVQTAAKKALYTAFSWLLQLYKRYQRALSRNLGQLGSQDRLNELWTFS